MWGGLRWSSTGQPSHESSCRTLVSRHRHQRATIFDSPPECSRRLRASSCPGLPPPPTALSPQDLVMVMMVMVMVMMEMVKMVMEKMKRGGGKRQNASRWVYCFGWSWLRDGHAHTLGPRRFHRGSRQVRQAASPMLVASGCRVLGVSRPALSPARQALPSSAGAG